MDLSHEKGASTWLSVLPLEEYGFALHKGAFRDALASRYGWSPANAPLNCVVVPTFLLNMCCHALRVDPSIRHNEIWDLTAALLSEVCHNVSTEPHLQPMTGEVMSGLSTNIQDGAQLDIAADGFWGSRFEQAFFDVKVLILMPPRIKRLLYLHAIIAMKMRKSGNMTNASVMLNMPLSLHLFSLALVALGLKPQQTISVWPLCYLLNGTRPIA